MVAKSPTELERGIQEQDGMMDRAPVRIEATRGDVVLGKPRSQGFSEHSSAPQEEHEDERHQEVMHQQKH